ncbi:hypothetical protein, variant 2 [Fonticula alba]|uniref:Uncharacterized protein n=1 Tax=Fonticula alba TaxID=691883 RepID=A0A058Z890_FONAL|nr:hypothetical protein, variant 1 [Fonticula alba]XP_009495744.1 hypothetical protein, variant 2 [Fonticula alba]KCV70137.1 hypothetical protein, variant 1 [Fonticula alba]KCV70138.1 hypothetical protein, variant 2 [Fonticula alba]|eukprot:XP_009495743.1 hypothetical protein, variant 1 [Fonticula alba]
MSALYKKNHQRLVLAVLPPKGEPKSHMDETQLAQLVHYASTRPEKLSRLMLFIQASLFKSHRARELPITETYVHMINAIVAKTAASYGSIYGKQILEVICYLLRCMSADGLPLPSSATSDIPLEDVRMATSLLLPLVAVRVPASEDPLLQSNFAPFIERLIASYTALLNRPAAPTANDRAISRLALTALRAICLGAASPLRRNDTPVIYGRVVSALMGVVWDAAHSSANARLFQGTVAAIGAEGAAGNFSETNSTLTELHRRMLGYHALRTLQHLASQSDVTTIKWLLDPTVAWLEDLANWDRPRGFAAHLIAQYQKSLGGCFDAIIPPVYGKAMESPASFALPQTEDHLLCLADLGGEEPARGEYQWVVLLVSDTLSADRSPLSSASSVRSFGSSSSETGVGGHGVNPSPMQLPPTYANPLWAEHQEPTVNILCWFLLSLVELLIHYVGTLPDRLACSLSALCIIMALTGTELDAAIGVTPHDWCSPLPSSASQLFSLTVGNLSSRNFAARSCTHALLHELLRSMSDAMPDGQRPEQPVLDAFAKAHGARLLVSLTSVFSRELTLTSGPASGADPLSVGDILGLAVALADYTGLQAAAAASDGTGDPAGLSAAGGLAVACVVAALAATADSASTSLSARAGHTRNLLALVACLYLSRLGALVPATVCPVPTGVQAQLVQATGAAVDLAALAAALPEFEAYLTDVGVALPVVAGTDFAPQDVTASAPLVPFDWVGLASALACSADELGTAEAGPLSHSDEARLVLAALVTKTRPEFRASASGATLSRRTSLYSMFGAPVAATATGPKGLDSNRLTISMPRMSTMLLATAGPGPSAPAAKLTQRAASSVTLAAATAAVAKSGPTRQNTNNTAEVKFVAYEQLAKSFAGEAPHAHVALSPTSSVLAAGAAGTDITSLLDFVGLDQGLWSASEMFGNGSQPKSGAGAAEASPEAAEASPEAAEADPGAGVEVVEADVEAVETAETSAEVGAIGEVEDNAHTEDEAATADEQPEQEEETSALQLPEVSLEAGAETDACEEAMQTLPPAEATKATDVPAADEPVTAEQHQDAAAAAATTDDEEEVGATAGTTQPEEVADSDADTAGSSCGASSSDSSDAGSTASSSGDEEQEEQEQAADEDEAVSGADAAIALLDAADEAFEEEQRAAGANV